MGVGYIQLPQSYTIDVVRSQGGSYLHKQVERRGNLVFVRVHKTKRRPSLGIERT
ncbi:hypothetical protein J4464_03610 [Candidatus Woesearchaeota archaeon]|nr:hypothetical protein [Candidatus Woesearchaeota archaeon]